MGVECSGTQRAKIVPQPSADAFLPLSPCPSKFYAYFSCKCKDEECKEEVRRWMHA